MWMEHPGPRCRGASMNKTAILIRTFTPGKTTQTQKHYFNFMVQHILLQSLWWMMISLPSTEGVFVCVHMLERNLLKRYGYETSWQQFPSQDPLSAICSKFLFVMLKTQRGEKAVWGTYRGKFTLTPSKKGGPDLGGRNGMETFQGTLRVLGNSFCPDHRVHNQNWKTEMQIFIRTYCIAQETILNIL